MTMHPGDRAADLIQLQKGEATEAAIYTQLADLVSDTGNRQVLLRLAAEEAEHAQIWGRYTQADPGPDRFRVLTYVALARIFGLTFGIKLMERRERWASSVYSDLAAGIPESAEIVRREKDHERAIIALIEEDRLRYLGSVVLGLNDALVEFTGSLAGFTFALQDGRLIATTGLIMGCAASLSMASSEYLSRESEGGERAPGTAALYTGLSYIATVILLILPFLVIGDPFAALPIMLAIAILIILFFTFYTSIAQDLPFWRRFIKMAMVSLGIAAISFVIGIVIRVVLNVDV